MSSISIARGSTFSFTIKLPMEYDLTNAKQVWVDFAQNNKNVIRLEKNDVRIANNLIMVDLTQDQTLAFNTGSARMQLRVLTENDQSLVEESMTELGMTGLDFAGFCKDPNYIDKTTPEDDVVVEEKTDTYNYSLCYEEFIALNTHMIQKLMKRVDELEKKNAELEAKLYANLGRDSNNLSS